MNKDRLQTLHDRAACIRIDLAELHADARPTAARARVALRNLLTRTEREIEALERTNHAQPDQNP